MFIFHAGEPKHYNGFYCVCIILQCYFFPLSSISGRDGSEKIAGAGMAALINNKIMVKYGD